MHRARALRSAAAGPAGPMAGNPEQVVDLHLRRRSRPESRCCPVATVPPGATARNTGRPGRWAWPALHAASRAVDHRTAGSGPRPRCGGVRPAGPTSEWGAYRGVCGAPPSCRQSPGRGPAPTAAAPVGRRSGAGWLPDRGRPAANRAGHSRPAGRQRGCPETLRAGRRAGRSTSRPPGFSGSEVGLRRRRRPRAAPAGTAPRRCGSGPYSCWPSADRCPARCSAHGRCGPAPGRGRAQTHPVPVFRAVSRRRRCTRRSPCWTQQARGPDRGSGRGSGLWAGPAPAPVC